MTRNYFEGVTYLQDVRNIAVNNLEKLNSKKFVKDFIEAYNAHICDQSGPYGAYNKRADTSAERYLEILRFVKALTDIKIGRGKIHLGISFKKGGINIHGDTLAIRHLVKAAKFKWNRGTQEWYSTDATMTIELPEVPNNIEDKQDSKEEKPVRTKNIKADKDTVKKAKEKKSVSVKAEEKNRKPAAKTAKANIVETEAKIKANRFKEKVKEARKNAKAKKTA